MKYVRKSTTYNRIDLIGRRSKQTIKQSFLFDEHKRQKKKDTERESESNTYGDIVQLSAAKIDTVEKFMFYPNESY